MTANALRHNTLAAWDAAGLRDGRRNRSAGLAGALTGRTFAPDVIAVGWFWAAVIAIDLLNDWVIAGLANGFRPFLDVGAEVMIWWSTWIAFSPIVVAASRRLVRDGTHSPCELRQRDRATRRGARARSGRPVHRALIRVHRSRSGID